MKNVMSTSKSIRPAKKTISVLAQLSNIVAD